MACADISCFLDARLVQLVRLILACRLTALLGGILLIVMPFFILSGMGGASSASNRDGSYRHEYGNGEGGSQVGRSGHPQNRGSRVE